jgi:hypothetical protein
MNSKSEERQLKDDSKEAHKKTKDFVYEVTKNEREAFENLRVMVDEEDIFTKLFCKKGLKEYYEKHLKDGIDLDYKTVSSRLNVARMIYDFKNEGIEITDKVAYTPLRDLMNAFNSFDNRKELRIEAWKEATKKHKIPNKEDINNAIDEIKKEHSDVNVSVDGDYNVVDVSEDDDENFTSDCDVLKEKKDKLNILEKKKISYEKNAENSFDNLPKEFQNILFKKRYNNVILLEALYGIDNIPDEFLTKKLIKKRVDETVEFLQDFISLLPEENNDQDYFEDCEENKEILSNVHLYYFSKFYENKTSAEYNAINREIKIISGDSK